MKAERFVSLLDSDFYAGVPDSQLKAFCNYLMDRYGTDPKHHIIAANEGNAAAIGAGYHLATGKTPVVYLQNSGQGNLVNPAASLLHEKIYGIPMRFVIGWRGEPGIPDEPQHAFQGEITLRLLEDLEISYFILKKETREREIADFLAKSARKQTAFVVCKDALEYAGKIRYENQNSLLREEAIRKIIAHTGTDLLVSTTGKTSRELFELREANGQGHQTDFLTVGSMGHSSSIALGLALHRPDKRIWCLDGDGAALMHLGAMAVIGAGRPENLVHIVLNNAAHESVGGMPTAAGQIDLAGIARSCGYPCVESADSLDSLDGALQRIEKSNQLSFLEIKCAIGSRTDLGRPTDSPQQSKQNFMRNLIKKPGFSS